MNYEVIKRHHIGCREGRGRFLGFGKPMEVLEGSGGVYWALGLGGLGFALGAVHE